MLFYVVLYVHFHCCLELHFMRISNFFYTFIVDGQLDCFQCLQCGLSEMDILTIRFVRSLVDFSSFFKNAHLKKKKERKEKNTHLM